jgi:predicted amidophosphoribosyltransferase
MDRCPYCKAVIEWGETICPNCGHELRDVGFIEDDLLSAEEDNEYDDIF